MCAFGFYKDAMSNMANNRQMLKSKRERHAHTKAQYYKGSAETQEMSPKKSHPVNHKALTALKARVGKTQAFEKWAFAIMALMVVAFVIWVMWG
jgi:hypothetical protein